MTEVEKTSDKSKGEEHVQAATSTYTAPPPLNFKALSETVHVFRPEARAKRTLAASDGTASPSSSSPSSSSMLTPLRSRSGAVPRVVLIMGWMNAPLRIVTKYASPYALLFPSATIIIKLSQGVSFMRSRQAQLAALERVAELVSEEEQSVEARSALRQQVAQLESSAKQAGLTMDVDSQNALSTRAGKEQPETSTEAKSNDARQDGILIHSFSDGGAYNVSQLLRLLKDRKALTPLAHIMDSSPGKASPYSGSTAMTIALANRPWIRIIVRCSIYLYLYCIYAWKSLLRQKTWSRIMRDRLNSPEVWSWPSGTARSPRLPPRLYLYSKSDALIDFRAVEEHAALAAKAAGLSAPLQLKDLKSTSATGKSIVALQRWNDIPHCDIGRQDFDGYWTAVRTFLEASM